MQDHPVSSKDRFFDGIFTDFFFKKLPPWAASLGLHGFLALLLTLGSVSLIIVGGGNRYGPELRRHRSDGRDEVDAEVTFDLNRRAEPYRDAGGSSVLMDAEIADGNETDNNEDYEYRESPRERIERERRELPTEVDSHDDAQTPEPSDAPFQGKYWNAAIGIGGGTGGGAFGGRFGGRRNLRASGGSRHTETAVLKGLIWLKNHQGPNGMWSCRDFSLNCAKGRCEGAGSTSDYDVGCTGLALLAFLGSGHTHRSGKFKKTAKKGLSALKKRQTRDGCFGEKTPDGHWIYNHAIASAAMAEAYGMSRNSLLEEIAQKGIDFLLSCQNPGAGWRYGVQTGENDSSVTAWAVLALKAARISGLKAPKSAVLDALKWFDSVRDPVYGRIGYASAGDPGGLLLGTRAARTFQCQETMTAAALLCRLWVIGRKERQNPAARRGACLVSDRPPQWDVRGGSIDMCYWFFGTGAMFDMGGPHWKAWYGGLETALLPNQKRDGCEVGSWDPVGPWGTAGGRVYATAINCLSLEIFYRYSRLPSEGAW